MVIAFCFVVMRGFAGSIGVEQGGEACAANAVAFEYKLVRFVNGRGVCTRRIYDIFLFLFHLSRRVGTIEECMICCELVA